MSSTAGRRLLIVPEFPCGGRNGGEELHLRGHVQVEDCNSLQAVEMHVATMTHLALGSCPQLEVLSLRAPALIHLDLQCVPDPSLSCLSPWLLHHDGTACL